MEIAQGNSKEPDNYLTGLKQAAFVVAGEVNSLSSVAQLDKSAKNLD